MGKSEPMRRTLVFVVDDEASIVETLCLILEREGFTVRAFHDGLAAYEHAQQEAPDIVVSDVMMPRMDGFILAGKMQGQFPRCRILLMSGNAYHMDAEQNNGKPKLEILAKPIHPAILIGKIRALAEE